jgi:ABC-type multidrug transport system fused ATPase/permease subunit
MSRFRLPRSGVLIRAAVILDIVGLLLLLGILFRISALHVGLFMLGSGMLTLGILLYLAAVIRDLRRRVFGHLQSLSMAFFDREKAGVLVSRMTADIEALSGAVAVWKNGYPVDLR